MRRKPSSQPRSLVTLIPVTCYAYPGHLLRLSRSLVTKSPVTCYAPSTGSRLTYTYLYQREGWAGQGLAEACPALVNHINPTGDDFEVKRESILDSRVYVP